MLRRLAFNLWYFGRPPWDSGISPPELFDFLGRHPPGRALDLGCGTGTNVITLAKHGWQVTGIDFAARAIQIARRKIKTAKIRAELITGDATRLDGITGPFDLALDIGCFHGVENRSGYLAQLKRVLAPKGHWLMYGFFKSAPHLSGPGLAAPDLDLIQSYGFGLLSRTDGADKRERPSAWFLFQKSLS
jgi:ubiquinone/menaquinone biosynthesis C-methylase UbiE